jgi:hypothetical protein
VGCSTAADLARPLDHPAPLGIALLASMHMGFLPALMLGLFPWVSLVCLLPLLPPPAVAALTQAPATEHRPAHD